MKQSLPDSKVNILLVDDKEENLLAHSEILAELGQTPVLARSGREALRHLLKDDFAVILLDVQMPEMDGFETAKLIRQRDRSKYTPIIFLTANANSDSSAAMGYSLGAVDYILKPVSADVLRYKVAFFVELFKKNLEIQHQAQLIRAIEQREYEAKLAQEQLRAHEQLLMKELETQRLERKSQELLNANRLKGEFLANMSHEIRTPMNAIIGMAELLINSGLAEDQRELACVIRDSGNALLSIINDILDLSKIEAGKLDLDVVNFSVVSLVEGAAELLADKAAEKNLPVTTFIAPDLPAAVAADSLRIRQVLINLISNAIKFTDEGKVTVEAHMINQTESGTLIKFSVSDTGIGLSESAIEKLFQPFSQADGSTSRKYGGTGLGLSICRRLVELMGGQIGVESQQGSGAAFWFTIPCGKATADVPVSAVQDLTDLRVLIVDDQESARQITNMYVTSWGMKADCASGGTQALFMMRTQAEAGRPYDVAIVDYVMPDMDGYSLAQSVRCDSRLDHSKLILFTAHDERGGHSKATEAGFAAYLLKPVRQSKLFDVISQVLRKSSDAQGQGNNNGAVAVPDRPASLADGSKLILVAEDSPTNQRLVLLQLNKLGYSAHVAKNGREAVNAASNHQYSLIFMDCQMPEMDGFQATSQIREREDSTGMHVPIIGLTAQAMEGDRERCLAAGMDDYISKPATLDKLHEVIQRWMPVGLNEDSARLAG